MARSKYEEFRRSIAKKAEREKGIPPDVLEAFDELADLQRGEPERAMLDVAHFHAGLLSHALEHVGDLTNRMAKAEHVAYGEGDHYVHEKARKIHRDLVRPYGFRREHRENVESNARYNNMPLREYDRKLDRLLKAYAEAHRRLPVYNRAQYAAREAAIALGEERFADATKHLQYLVELVEDREKYEAVAHSFKRRPNGSLVTM
jgi:hypothetical protein